MQALLADRRRRDCSPRPLLTTVASCVPVLGNVVSQAYPLNDSRVELVSVALARNVIKSAVSVRLFPL